MLVDLTSAEMDQILSLIFENERDGWRYGRKDYWDKRNERIKKKLEDELNGKSCNKQFYNR